MLWTDTLMPELLGRSLVAAFLIPLPRNMAPCLLSLFIHVQLVWVQGDGLGQALLRLTVVVVMSWGM